MSELFGFRESFLVEKPVSREDYHRLARLCQRAAAELEQAAFAPGVMTRTTYWVTAEVAEAAGALCVRMNKLGTVDEPRQDVEAPGEAAHGG